MPGTAGFSANDIAQAMKAKAWQAFGDKVTYPFGVEAIAMYFDCTQFQQVSRS